MLPGCCTGYVWGLPTVPGLSMVAPGRAAAAAARHGCAQAHRHTCRRWWGASGALPSSPGWLGLPAAHAGHHLGRAMLWHRSKRLYPPNACHRTLHEELMHLPAACCGCSPFAPRRPVNSGCRPHCAPSLLHIIIPAPGSPAGRPPNPPPPATPPTTHTGYYAQCSPSCRPPALRCPAPC